MTNILSQSMRVSLFLLPPLSGFAQLVSNYEPIRNSGIIPATFFSTSVETVKEQINGIEILNDEEKDKFCTEVYYVQKKLFESGHIYLDNDVSKYIKALASRVLESTPLYTEKIKIYLTRSVEANAFCMADGSLYINIGLLRVLDNESQLAFIIAHEIAHYIKSHALSDFKRLSDIVVQELAYDNEASNIFRKLQYSKESEFDADGFAIQLILQSGFDASEAGNALQKLDVEDNILNSDSSLQSFDRYFKNKFFTYDTTWIKEKAIDRMRNSYKNRERSGYLTDEIGDLFNSHPDIEKRVLALKEIIESSDVPVKSNEPLKGSEEFDVVREISLFELVENTMREAYYIHTVYFATTLLEKYPDNIFLNTALSKSMYWLSYYKEIHNGELPVEEPYITNDKAFFRLCCLFEKVDMSACKKLSYGFSKTISERFGMQESILFYLALTTERYLGKNAAFPHYNKYILEYPVGKFIAFVK